MGDTTRIRVPQRDGASEPRTASPATELQLRIPCGGRTSAQVLDDISRGLTEALAKQRDPLLVLEDLGRLQDSIMSLIKGLARLVYKYPRPVTCWESSGLAEAFISVVDAAEHSKPAPQEPPTDF